MAAVVDRECEADFYRSLAAVAGAGYLARALPHTGMATSILVEMAATIVIVLYLPIFQLVSIVP